MSRVFNRGCISNAEFELLSRRADYGTCKHCGAVILLDLPSRTMTHLGKMCAPFLESAVASASFEAAIEVVFVAMPRVNALGGVS